MTQRTITPELVSLALAHLHGDPAALPAFGIAARAAPWAPTTAEARRILRDAGLYHAGRRNTYRAFAMKSHHYDGTDSPRAIADAAMRLVLELAAAGVAPIDHPAGPPEDLHVSIDVNINTRPTLSERFTDWLLAVIRRKWTLHHHPMTD